MKFQLSSTPTSGFTLIELLAALALSSILAFMLFSILFQLSNSLRIGSDLIDTEIKIVTAQHRFEADFSGSFVPLQMQNRLQKESIEKKKKTEKTTQELQIKKIEKVFYGSVHDGMVDTVTFITNNPMQAYWEGTIGRPEVKIVRVVYRLIRSENDEPDLPPSYRLMRQESPKLDFELFKQGGKISEHELIDNIKSMSIEYQTLVPKESSGDNVPDQDVSLELQKSNEWTQPENKSVKGEKKKLIPNFVQITLFLWDDDRKKAIEYFFLIPLASSVDSSKKQKKELQKKPSIQKQGRKKQVVSVPYKKFTLTMR